ncbi:succinylglutamate desuccinylase/aspartoacylase domain-containing protein [Thalassomonas actiniarum]|uniref:Succinylglutamate desuccinylase/aspartoacylase family protein n=1 Tax=Thalassomonas actiniarum TaxID=485447 RepID=A0AAE9YQK3_9GAMM|nr:succinylglutamate desuccinylase/aspartoacylase family protein [Thalassomonas actiniarum]WDD99395.1 succinylglutamate desuccinylase/aspartoacylase family protein [Thalassomonas actiniarum]
MAIVFNEIGYFKDPSPGSLPPDYQEFLLSLAGPTVIDISGQDTSRCRVITSLLHGNEPSGLIAIHRWLTSADKLVKPITNIRFILGSPEAASLAPLLSHRYLPGGKDLNRCFGSGKNSGYYLRANLIADAISQVSPEIVVDLHNTSGSGPAFAVCHGITANVLSLSSFFCETIILSAIRLGALLEQDFSCPTITVECGGCNDEFAHELAYEGICHILACETTRYFHQEREVEVVYQPHRLRLREDINLSYGGQNSGFHGVTLKADIEQYNFTGARKGEVLGWLDHNRLNNLQLTDEHGTDIIGEYFCVSGHRLLCAADMRIFMATTIKDIAINDCLFYVIKTGH